MNRNQGNGGMRRIRLVYAVTTTKSLFFFRGRIDYLTKYGFDVSVIASPGPGLESVVAEGGAAFGVPMKREISPFHDLRALWKLWRVLRRISPDITNVATPKAGLLGGLAAVLAKVPHRVYSLHGLRLETTRGWKRRLLWCTEWVACRCAHRVHCVSHSLRDVAIGLKLVDSGKAYVILNGTSNGIDHHRFEPTPEREDDARKRRAGLAIEPSTPVIGYVGRLTRDKGIPELYEAFLQLVPQFPGLRLLLIGDFERGDPVPAATQMRIEADPRVLRTGWVSDPAPYYHLMSVLALPTHREGFGLASIEAQASGIPVVVTRATGVRDSALEGITGFITPVGDVPALASAIGHLLSDEELRKRMGNAGCKWVEQTFDRGALWAEMRRLYIEISGTSMARVQER
jgi:glycosyltransferase involved in cell wall biosynthesis